MSFYDELTESQQFASRVIADHARSTAFAIADGILPGNEGRNYVLRKIMRRAIYHGREHLGLNDLFFHKVCDFVVGEMSGAFPELEIQREFISKMVRIEEERFGNTVTVGLRKLEEMFERLTFVQKSQIGLAAHGKTIDFEMLLGKFEQEVDDEDIEKSQLLSFLKSSVETMVENEDVKKQVFEQADADTSQFFRQLAQLYDTFGTPRDLIRVFLDEKKLEFEEDDFNARFDAALQELQSQGEVGQTSRKSQPLPLYAELLEKVGANQFHGYDMTHLADAKVVAILEGETQVDELVEGKQGGVVVDNTPFYAEAGGQVGDMGRLVGTGGISGQRVSENESTLRVLESSHPAAPPPAHAGGSDFIATVNDTYSPVSGLIIHKVTVDKGTIRVGDVVNASVDTEKRDATRRNHTATHLVHAALREVLGTHVKQAGSVVAPTFLRFDFTHYQPMTAAEIAEVEDLVNRHILENNPVNTNVMAIEEAMRDGAMALFGEKYGSAVRVLSVGDGVFSKELCGGTHVRATGDIGSFKITGDEAIASGVRRIRAITGFDAFSRFREDERLIERSLHELNTQRDNLPNAIARLQEDLKKTRKEMDELKLKIALGSGQGAVADGQSGSDETREIMGVNVLGKIVEGLDGNGTRQLSDTLLARLKSGVVIIGRSDEGKVGIIVRVSDDLTKRVKAGDIIREIAPIVGGRGGGKPDMAEGGGTEPEKLAEAIDASFGVIERMLG